MTDVENRHPGLLGGLAGAVLACLSASVAGSSPGAPADSGRPVVTVDAYAALAASQSRNYDRKQDISPRQLAILLEVADRTGTSLGQALATGELESARTWNDYIRPTLRNGSLGAATGVWQFMPGTFHRIVKKYGTQLLAASDADAESGRARLDLGEGPFSDAQVREIVSETAAGARPADDRELQLLRHNFAVLAFAKHYLSLDSGATTPEEDYLFHFLGEKMGRRVLALAQGLARDTLCVKAAEPPSPGLPPRPTLVAGRQDPIGITRVRAILQSVPPAASDSLDLFSPLPRSALETVSESRSPRKTDPPSKARIEAVAKARSLVRTMPAIVSEPLYLYPSDAFDSLQEPMGDWGLPGDGLLPSADWGLPADSPTVTGNLGMFYRDGKGQTQPYTWGEFLEHLGKLVRAANQPALVRAKYGVGLSLNGGDVPERAFDPAAVTDALKLWHEKTGDLLVAEGLVTGTLSPEETRLYARRLAELVRLGEDGPMDRLPPESLAALKHMGLLPKDAEGADTASPQVQKALRELRQWLGKDEPDDPANASRLMPAERVALELYERRLAGYAGLQAGQQDSLATAASLSRIAKMPAGLRKAAAPRLSLLQAALAQRGLLTAPVQKVVWRDKKRKKHVEYRTAPFPGKADKATVEALNLFQLRNGLRRTDGVLDAVTLGMLDLPPMGQDIVMPLAGPQCPIEAASPSSPLPSAADPRERLYGAMRVPASTARPRPALGIDEG